SQCVNISLCKDMGRWKFIILLSPPYYHVTIYFAYILNGLSYPPYIIIGRYYKRYESLPWILVQYSNTISKSCCPIQYTIQLCKFYSYLCIVPIQIIMIQPYLLQVLPLTLFQYYRFSILHNPYYSISNHSYISCPIKFPSEC